MKVIAICGKICSGKTYYAKILKEKNNAIILSCDELTSILFNNNLGDNHDDMSKKIWKYLLLKACEIINSGCNVILDWGFWSKEDRKNIKLYFRERNIDCELHYIDIDNISWKKNIQERNNLVINKEDTLNYYLDNGLKEKLLNKWEEPDKSEIDIWYKLKR